MSWLTDALNEKAVWWRNVVPGGAGQRSFDDPIEINVRWEQRSVLFTNAAGEELQSEHVVYPDRDVAEGDMLMRGTLDDIDSGEEADPLTVDGAHTVRGFESIREIEGDLVVRKAML